MNITMIPIAELKPNPKNVRLHSAKQLEEYQRSVQKFGQTKAIVIDETNTILIGNGLYEAMKALSYTEAACFIKAGMSEHDKLKMMMADNKIYSLGVDIEPIEADDFMTGYGILDDSTKAGMEKAADRYQQEEAEFAASAENLTPVGQNGLLESPGNGVSGQGNVGVGISENPLETSGNALQRRLIVCPKCGEKIWL